MKFLIVVRVVQLVNFTAELFIVIFCNVSKYGGYQVFASVILFEKVKFSIVVNAYHQLNKLLISVILDGNSNPVKVVKLLHPLKTLRKSVTLGILNVLIVVN